MSSLYGLHVEVQTAILLFYSGISAVCQRAGRPIAQPSHVVLISAEVLCLCLHFIRAVAVIDNLRQHMYIHATFTRDNLQASTLSPEGEQVSHSLQYEVLNDGLACQMTLSFCIAPETTRDYYSLFSFAIILSSLLLRPVTKLGPSFAQSFR